MKRILIIAIMLIALYGCAQQTIPVGPATNQTDKPTEPVTVKPVEPVKPAPVKNETVPQKPTANTTDAHGCTTGYSWNTDLNACAPPLDDAELEAAMKVVAPISYPVTVVSVVTEDCSGCFTVTLLRLDNNQTIRVPLND
jgi:hypothetical protein